MQPQWEKMQIHGSDSDENAEIERKLSLFWKRECSNDHKFYKNTNIVNDYEFFYCKKSD